MVRSDNGPQYSSAEFMSFASSYGFQHITNSPKFPQSKDREICTNSEESAVEVQ